MELVSAFLREFANDIALLKFSSDPVEDPQGDIGKARWLSVALRVGGLVLAGGAISQIGSLLAGNPLSWILMPLELIAAHDFLVTGSNISRVVRTIEGREGLVRQVCDLSRILWGEVSSDVSFWLKDTWFLGPWIEKGMRKGLPS